MPFHSIKHNTTSVSNAYSQQIRFDTSLLGQTNPNDITFDINSAWDKLFFKIALRTCDLDQHPLVLLHPKTISLVTYNSSTQLGKSGGISASPLLEQSTISPRQLQSAGQVAEAAGRRRAWRITVVVNQNNPVSAAIFPQGQHKTSLNHVIVYIIRSDWKLYSRFSDHSIRNVVLNACRNVKSMHSVTAYYKITERPTTRSPPLVPF